MPIRVRDSITAGLSHTRQPEKVALVMGLITLHWEVSFELDDIGSRKFGPVLGSPLAC